jgi:hypothetical protein
MTIPAAALQTLEATVDAHHQSHPILRLRRQGAESVLLSVFAPFWAPLLKRVGLDAFPPVFESWTNAFCRALVWASGATGMSDRKPSDDDLRDGLDLLSLAHAYEQVSTIFIAAHQGYPVTFDDRERRVIVRLPARLRHFHAASTVRHQVALDETLAPALSAAEAQIVQDTGGRPSLATPAAWRKMLDLAAHVLRPDWETDVQGDVGGFSFETFRWVSLTLRQLSVLHLRTPAEYIRVPRASFVQWVSGRAAVDAEEVDHVIADLLFDPKLPYSTPLVPANEGICWAPMAVLTMHHERELWVRMRSRRSTIHDALSDVRAAVPLRKIADVLRRYPALRMIEAIGVPRDLDAAILDEERRTVLCIEAKNMQPPRSFTDFLHADGRRSRDGSKWTDGLIKGARVQLPQILADIRSDMPRFLERLGVAREQRGDGWTIGATVVSNWTLGTGAADMQGADDIPLINVAILAEALEAGGGKLDAALQWIRSRSYLTMVTPSPIETSYAGFSFRVEWE